MDMRNLRNNAFDIYRRKKMYAWCLAIVLALFTACVCLTGLLEPLLYYVLVPLVILPFSFAFLMIFFYCKNENVELNFKNIIKFFKVYFNPAYRGTFKVFFSFLKTLIVTTIASTIAFIACYLIYRLGYPEFYASTEATILEWANDPTVELNLQTILDANDGLLNTMVCYTELITSGISLVTFVTVTMYEACYLPIRANIKTNNYRVFVSALKGITRKNKKDVLKAYIKLNFLIPILLIIGYGLGYLLSYLLNIYELEKIIAICSSCSFVPLLFFLPFYFANTEAIAYEFKNDIVTFISKATEEELKRQEESARIMEEYANKLKEEIEKEKEKDSEES